ncbi:MULTISPECIES: CpaF family protein [unclassified Mesorhizobium]|uniref:CpaF family protein n=1 Tax=unclassified Mesorhizobium TaxID=325217 RepID=UPI0003CE41AD|nr:MULTISPECIES: CpaF family protein [unclassified Mesorhizobium]ESY51667.1 CpaF pilus assembly protein, ATPase CpaF [Mesorhizobium sp. LNJC374B00]ESY58553.1 CpaF pilus assembly protein, ATPase CpaF [Mesorhizobium sp. LNJC372A00]ESZ64006.1 CpaF pilus assembly protein, ATPase CpaF [Mesorhizobium sp. L103C131B0]WJI79068.1 CpaF family protein [Mesorhizobium sp. C374B]WJI85604.1 CpaF family protein [Mesorhizobium sp. C372A]
MANGIIGRFYRSRSEDLPQAPVVASDLALAEKTKTEVVPSVPPLTEEPKPEERGALGPDMVSERVNLHRYLLDRINLGLLETAQNDELAAEIRPLVREYVRARNFPLNARELDTLISDITDEMLGLGPIEPLLKDDTISDILINGHEHVYIERYGQLEDTPIRFKDEDHLMRVINKIVTTVGRRVDESSPLVDARLPDGSRVNAAIRPVAIDGPLVSIRKFSRRPYTLDRLVESHSMAKAMQVLLTAAVKGKVSMIISGGTGSGKTTMLNALSSQISNRERLITIEDAAELQLQQPHVGRLETRPPTLDGRGEIRQRELLKNALRMRPDRIIVGEVRGEEAFDMLQAMNTGHEGSMTTIHANTPRDAVSRLEQMIGMAGMPMSQLSIKSQIASAITLIVQVERLHDGTRRLVSVTEITGMEGDVVQMQEIMKFQKLGVDDLNRVNGQFRATGIRPRFLEHIAELGFQLPGDIFDPGRSLV